MIAFQQVFQRTTDDPTLVVDVKDLAPEIPEIALLGEPDQLALAVRPDIDDPGDTVAPQYAEDVLSGPLGESDGA
jgi:hypothetical protein